MRPSYPFDRHALTSWPLLSTCLTGACPCEGRTDAHWQAVTALAHRTGLAPLLFRAVKAAGCAPPAETRTALANSYWLTLSQNMRAHRRLVGLLQALERAGVPCILLKGLALAEAVYGDWGVRPMADVDLLVRPGDLDQAAGALANQGYLPPAARSGERSPAFARRFHGEQSFCPQNGTGMCVDLHTHLVAPTWFRASTRIELEPLWARARPLSIDGAAVLQLAAEDELLYLCLHAAVNHDLTAVRLFVDIDRLIRIAPALDWNVCVERALDWRVRNAVYFALDLARQLLGTPVPPAALQRLQLSRPSRWLMGRLVDPAQVAQGEIGFARWSRHLLNFVLMDHMQDRLRVMARMFFPGREWIMACYSIERPSLVALYTAAHPLRVLWLAAVGLHQLVGARFR